MRGIVRLHLDIKCRKTRARNGKKPTTTTKIHVRGTHNSHELRQNHRETQTKMTSITFHYGTIYHLILINDAVFTIYTITIKRKKNVYTLKIAIVWKSNDRE